MRTAAGWAWFAVVQLVAGACMVVGWALLLPLAIAGWWSVEESRHYPGRYVSVWRWRWFDAVYGNAEDGVLGAPWYLPSQPAWWRCYMWSAWRNSTNNLRWVFAWRGGPWWQLRWRGWYAQAGFRPSNGWPVLSAGKGQGSPE